MDLDDLKDELAKKHWKKLGPGTHMDVEFDLVGTKLAWLARTDVLIKTMPALDNAALDNWQKAFEVMSENSKSLWFGRVFVLCLVVGGISPDLHDFIYSDTFGLGGLVRLRGGGGIALVADEATRKVYGRIPEMPIGARVIGKQVTDILNRALQQYSIDAPPVG